MISATDREASAAPEILEAPAAENRPAADLYDQEDSDNVCFLCGNPRYEPLFEPRHFGFPIRFQRCACGLVKQTPMPNRRFFEWFFNSDLFFSAKDKKSDQIWGFYDYFKDEPCRLATSKARYRRLEPYLGEGKLDIMKIGPSTGTFLYVASQHDHHAIGCDVSANFVDYAKKNYGIQIDHGRYEEMGYPDSSFDVILLFNVIENVPNVPEFLQAIHRTLKPGGRFVFNYVDMKGNLVGALQKERYFIYRPPICYVHDRHSVNLMLERFGFEPVKVLRDWRYMHLEKILSLLDWMRVLGVAKRLRLDQWMFPIYAYPSRIVVARRS